MIQALVVTKNTGIDNPKPKIKLTDVGKQGQPVSGARLDLHLVIWHPPIIPCPGHPGSKINNRRQPRPVAQPPVRQTAQPSVRQETGI